VNEERADFRNRHGYLSINVMLVIGASGRFHCCGSSMPGSQHDSTIFNNSDLFHKLKVELWSLFRRAILVGDSAYCSTNPFLATPFLDAVAMNDERKQAYNTAHCRARVNIEQGMNHIHVHRVDF
jgi:hypothetical protein